MAHDPLDPLDAPGLTPLTPFELDAPVRPASPSLPPPPASLVPESVRQRAAFDLPFALDPGGLSGAREGGGASGGFDADTEGVPVGLPDFSALMGLKAEEPESEPTPTWEPESLPSTLEDDDGLMALPSPSMIGPSPFGGADVDADDPEEDDNSDNQDFGDGLHPPPGDAIYSDDTQQEQLPPTPVHAGRSLGHTFDPQVSGRWMMEALAERDAAHMRHLIVAFLLGTASAVVGFVAARWALTTFGQ